MLIIFLLILNYNNDKLKLIGSRSCICENQTETCSSSSKKTNIYTYTAQC